MTKVIEFPWECPVCDTRTIATQARNGPDIKTVKACEVCGLTESFDGKRVRANVMGLEFDFSTDLSGSEFTKHLFGYEVAINDVRRVWQSKQPVKTKPIVEFQILYVGDSEHEVTFRRRHSDNVIVARSYALNSNRRRLIQNTVDQLRPKPDIYLFSTGIMLTWDESKF